MAVASEREPCDMLALALSHVALQLGLCNAVTKGPPAATIAVHVRMAYRVGEPEFDKTLKVQYDQGSDAFIEFDIRPGLYRMTVEAPKYRCSFAKFLDVLPDRNRLVTGKLDDGVPAPPVPQLLMDGTAPTSFLYTKPTYVLLDKSIACTTPVHDPPIAQIDYEYDQGAYYLWMYGDPKLESTDPTVALRLRTPTGLFHFVRVPVPYSAIGHGWPGNVRFDISEDMIDGLATDKTDTLLCPKLWETRVQ